MAGIYHERSLPTPRPYACDLVELDTQLLPATLSSLAGRMGKSHWESVTAWVEGYSRVSWQGALLLMGCKEDIIQEIRGVRGTGDPEQPTDLDTFPVGTYPGRSLSTLTALLYAEPNSAAELLTDIRDLLEAQAASDGDELAALQQIILLLGAAV